MLILGYFHINYLPLIFNHFLSCEYLFCQSAVKYELQPSLVAFVPADSVVGPSGGAELCTAAIKASVAMDTDAVVPSALQSSTSCEDVQVRPQCEL